MRRTSIKPRKLHSLAVAYLATLPAYQPSPKGGRPRTYDDALILTIASIQNLNSYSFREALEYCEDYFSDLPALSSYYDRLALFTPTIAQGFIAYIGKQIVLTNHKSTNAPPKGRVFIMDGTGFSFFDCYPMKLFRGLEIRKIRNHVKIGALNSRAGKRRFVVSAQAGPPYAGDTTLLYPLLAQLPQGEGAVLGDKGFDSIRIMTMIMEKGYYPVIPLKEGNVVHPIRKLSAENAAHDLYGLRPLVEGLFGNVKQKLSSHVCTFNLEIAQTFALLRFALLNVSVLVAIEQEQLWWIWFPNSARVINWTQTQIIPSFVS